MYPLNDGSNMKICLNTTKIAYSKNTLELTNSLPLMIKYILFFNYKTCQIKLQTDSEFFTEID